MTRRVTPLDLPHIVRAPVGGARPRFLDVDPRSLEIDESYQRDLSRRSVRLIQRMVAHWDWAKFRPPVVVEVLGALHVIDGQHTAIAALTHGAIATIPVGIVEAESLSARAQAFVGLNRDRIQVTVSQVHFAELAAGGEDATTIAQVCARAGVTLLRLPPSRGRFRPGESLAISTIRALVAQHGAMKARVVLQTLKQARCAPITADLIRAVAALFYAPEYQGTFAGERLSLEIRALEDVVPAEALRLARERRMPLWRALAAHLAGKGERHVARTAA